jgi:hypothetical protein
MPRTSLAELQTGVVRAAVQRPDPPEELTPLEADVWERIVSSKPADWFPRSTFELLKAYCRHSVNADKFSAAINNVWAMAGDTGLVPDLKLIDHLSSLRERESKVIASLATKMRLSQQSIHNAKRVDGLTIEHDVEQQRESTRNSTHPRRVQLLVDRAELSDPGREMGGPTSSVARLASARNLSDIRQSGGNSQRHTVVRAEKRQDQPSSASPSHTFGRSGAPTEQQPVQRSSVEGSGGGTIRSSSENSEDESVAF